MKLSMFVRAATMALLLGAAACSGSDIASPGATNAGTGAGSGGGSGGGTGSGGACPAGFTCSGTITINGVTNTIALLPNSITGNLTVPRVTNVVYRINGRVEVGTDAGQTSTNTTGVLTIQPGVTLFGDEPSDFLVVNRGGRLVADGRPGGTGPIEPIVFTAREDLAGTVNPVSDVGLWGGVVILGRAPILNCGTGGAAGTSNCQNTVEGVPSPLATYGGTQPDDSSGVLRYVRVQYAGNPLSPGNELNGITFGGVGRGTTVEYVQVHNNRDDGIEMFGGNVNLRYIVLTGIADDSFDTDGGYSGNVQFMVVRQSGPRQERLIEASFAGSNPTLSNVTFVGAKGASSTAEADDGVNYNRGTSFRLYNSVISAPTFCASYGEPDSAGNPVAQRFPADNVLIASTLFGCPTAARGQTANGTTASSLVSLGSANNVIRTSATLNGVIPGPAEVAANSVAINPTTLNSGGSTFFQAANYVGAFSPSETATSNWAAGWTIQLFPDAGCPSGTTQSSQTLNGQRVCTVAGTLLSDLTLTAGNIYEIDGRVEVGRDVGQDNSPTGGDRVTLTVESGVTVFGDEQTDYLVVNRGSKLITNGTRSAPVIFTAERDVPGAQNPLVDNNTETGLWGGIVLLGLAPIQNCSTGGVAGTANCQNSVEGVPSPLALYGGQLPNDSSGRINFTQVKYAGNPLSPGNELNGITFGGVGDGTEVSYLQVHNNRDDGVEFFGGTVNTRYVVLTGIADDAFDTDGGYDGASQFVLIRQTSPRAERMIEASFNDSRPGVGPKIANYTFTGIPAAQSSASLEADDGANFNRGTTFTLLNGIIEGRSRCITFGEPNSGSTTPAQRNFPEEVILRGNLFGCPSPALGVTTGGTTAASVISASGAGNVERTSGPVLSGLFQLSSDSALNANALSESQLQAVDPWFVAAPYLGAFDPATETSSSNWTIGWTCGLVASSPC